MRLFLVLLAVTVETVQGIFVGKRTCRAAVRTAVMVGMEET